MDFLNRMYIKMCCNLRNFFQDEEGAVDIVAIVVLIGIAVLLAVLFKDRIELLLDTLLSTIEGKATNAVTN